MKLRTVTVKDKNGDEQDVKIDENSYKSLKGLSRYHYLDYEDISINAQTELFPGIYIARGRRAWEKLVENAGFEIRCIINFGS